MKISERRSYQLNCGFFFLVGDSQTIFNGSVFLDCYLAGENFVLNMEAELSTELRIFFLVGDSQTIFNGSVILDCYLAGENFVLNIEPEVMYGAGSGSGWGKFVLF